MRKSNKEIEALYASSSALRDVELKGNHRLDVRRDVLKLAPKSAVGAELGVFTGMFSEVLAEVTAPQTLFLVDPWSKLHNDLYPNWGAYTANRRLPTAVAKEAAKIRAEAMPIRCELVEAFSIDWLQSFTEPFLDWVYLDAGHKYLAVLNDLRCIERKMRPNGIIMGDDCWLHEDHNHDGVAAAINEFLEYSDYEIVYHDQHGQWALRAPEIAR